MSETSVDSRPLKMRPIGCPETSADSRHLKMGLIGCPETSVDSRHLKMGLIGCPETSVRYYHYSLLIAQKNAVFSLCYDYFLNRGTTKT